MAPELIIEGRVISDDSDCYVVAEIGANHMGKLDIAKEMITRARECGVNAVKFQKRDNKSLWNWEFTIFTRISCAWLPSSSIGRATVKTSSLTVRKWPIWPELWLGKSVPTSL